MNKDRILRIEKVNYDSEYYNSLKIKNINNNSNSIQIFCDKNIYALPFHDIIVRNSFFSLYEIHDFFKNKKKYKYNILENDEYYLIEYMYKEKISNFDYKIKLTIDKEIKSIVSFNKSLINKKNNIIKSGLTNAKIVQSFKYIKHDETFVLKKNKNNILEFVSENVKIEYEFLNKKSNGKKFKYDYVIEPTPSIQFNKNELINIQDLL